MRNNRVMKFKEVNRVTDLLNNDITEAKFISPEPGCPFCPANGKVTIIADLGSMYLVRVKDPDTMEDLPDRWLVIPANHAMTPEELPLGWGESLVELTNMTGVVEYNWSLNYGKDSAGQTIDHLHIWILDRSTDELNKGMGWMITEIVRLRRLCKQLKGRLDGLGKLPSADTGG